MRVGSSRDKTSTSPGNDMGMRQKVNDIPTTESILRVVSLYPTLNTEETLKEFITNHIINPSINPIQRNNLPQHLRTFDHLQMAGSTSFLPVILRSNILKNVVYFDW